MSEVKDSIDPSRLRQLHHDIGNNLSVLSLGLRALSGVRDEIELFSEIIETMQSNTESLKENVKLLMEHTVHSPPVSPPSIS
jgi:hypothetical protein